MRRHFPDKLSMLLTSSALVIMTAACSPQQETKHFSAKSDAVSSHVEAALADQGDLTMFYQALHSTGVLNELNDNNEYTIFAPTNAAFAQIKPGAYPCFYAVQCRPQVAAILRNHIVPRNESIDRFSKWGGDIATIGNHRLDVEEPYKGHYTVEGYRVLYQNEVSGASHPQGDKISLYRIDGIIANDQDMAPFRTVPLVVVPASVIEKTVTTYRTPLASSYAPQTIMPNAYLVPGGYTSDPATTTDEYYDESGITRETTTATHTTMPR